MKKVKIFLGIACMTVAIAAVSATKLNANFSAPEYYISNVTSTCELLPSTSGCVIKTTEDCSVDVNQDEQNVPVFDERINGVCTTRLSKP